MLGLTTIWSKKNGADEPLKADGATSIARQVVSAPRAEARPLSLPQAPVAIDTRLSPRFVPRRAAVMLLTDGGKKLAARIINVSINGVAVEADFTQLPSSSIVMVGERRVRQGRKITRGAVFLFDAPLSPDIFSPDLIL